MDGIRILLLGVGIVLLLINFFINSANIIKIIQYCFQTNTLNQYWTLFFKNCVSGRALISSIIGFVLALCLFILISPIVLIRSLIFKKKTTALMGEGLLFHYPDLEIKDENARFNSNINSIVDIDFNDIPVSGKIRMDAIFIVAAINKACKEKQLTEKVEVMHPIQLRDKKTAVVPLFLKLEEREFPMYFIYNQEQKQQYLTVRNTLFESGYKNCVYFSLVSM